MSCNEEVEEVERGGVPNQIQMSPTLAEIWQHGERVQTKTKGLASNPLSSSLSDALVLASVIAMHYLSL